MFRTKVVWIYLVGVIFCLGGCETIDALQARRDHNLDRVLNSLSRVGESFDERIQRLVEPQ